MRINRILGSTSLLVITSFAVPIYAQQLDVPSFVDSATRGTDIANRCADMTDKFLTVRVPPDHAAARTAVAVNASSPTAKPMPISPDNVNYLKQVDVFRLLLSSCGKQFAAVNGPIQQNTNRLVALINKDTMPRADAQKFATALKTYNLAHQRMVKSILALSNDKQVESHMGDVIVRDFIEPSKTTN